MRRARHFSVTPGTAIALVALFFALGGSAFAVGERIQSPSVAQQRCTNGAVRGDRDRHGEPGPGHREHSRTRSRVPATSSRARFNCTGRAIQVRRVQTRRSTRSGSSATPRPSAIASGVGAFSSTTETIGPGAFRVLVQDVGRASQADGPFMIVAV